MGSGTLLITCGAIARELESLRRSGQLGHVTLSCLDAALHNRPEQIAPAVEAMIVRHRDDYAHIFVAYADCGTGGMLDRVLERYAIERLPGAHCYEFFAGAAVFEALAAAEPGTFYLTDFLTRHFDRLVRRGLGLDRHPQLMPMYFGNYRRLVFLAQEDDAELAAFAQRHAEFLGLDYERILTGLAPLAQVLDAQVLQWRN